MSRGLGILLVVLLFGAVGAGARYALELLPEMSWSGPTATPLDQPSAHVSGPIAPAPRPAPAQVNAAMEGLAPRDHAPLSDWSLDEGRAGEVAQAFIAGPQPAPLGERPLAGDDVLLLAGWAGDPTLGLRFDSVLFSLCDRVIGWAEVNQPRPDVVRYINPALTRSGWTARLPVALFPRCQSDMLRTWAVGPAGVLYPLQGAVPIPTLPPRPKGWMPPARAPFDPQDGTELQTATLQVNSSSVTLRRCPGEQCAALSTLEKGRYHAARLDAKSGWSLILTSGHAGWMSDQDFTWQADGSLPPGLSKPWPKPEPNGPYDSLERTTIVDQPTAPRP